MHSQIRKPLFRMGAVLVLATCISSCYSFRAPSQTREPERFVIDHYDEFEASREIEAKIYSDHRNAQDLADRSRNKWASDFLLFTPQPWTDVVLLYISNEDVTGVFVVFQMVSENKGYFGIRHAKAIVDDLLLQLDLYPYYDSEVRKISDSTRYFYESSFAPIDDRVVEMLESADRVGIRLYGDGVERTIELSPDEMAIAQAFVNHLDAHGLLSRSQSP